MATTVANSKRIVWFWQKNPDLWNEDEQKEWKRYSDFENEFIEEAYQRRENEVRLNDYVISFEHNMQFNKHDRNRQRTVTRKEIDVSNYVREERFCYPERAVKLFDDGNKPWDPVFYGGWFWKNKQIKEDYPEVAELAAQGTNISVLLANLVYLVHVLSLQVFYKKANC
jgi:hypothetical protein